MSAKAQQKRPNVLVFLSDQESRRVDRKLLKLPNRERIERRGVTFQNAWCATPQCSPARGALWTGLYPHRSRVITNIGAVGATELSPSIPNLFRTFQDAGYATGYFGKWHLSDDRGIDDEAFGLDQTQERSGSAGDAGVAAAAAEWIGRSRDEPWLAIVSLLQPHDIYEFPGRRDELASKGKQAPVRPGMEAPASGVELLSKRPKPQRLFNEQDQGRATNDYGPEDWRRYRSFYYDLIEDADRDLGTALDAVGDLDDTIVFYSSDHGDALGEHGLAFKGPFAYEELLNIPLTISWPRMFSEARSSEELVSHIDLLPTACDLAGVEAPGGIDGVSLRPALGGKSLGREEIFAEYHSKQRWANPMRMVREKRWKLNVYLDGGRELYDLEKDPHELNNLAGEARARPEEERLMAKLEDWAARTNDTRWFARK